MRVLPPVRNPLAMREASYSFAWGAVVVVIGTAVVLAVPYLALIALIFVMVAALAAVGAPAWTTITALFVAAALRIAVGGRNKAAVNRAQSCRRLGATAGRSRTAGPKTRKRNEPLPPP